MGHHLLLGPVTNRTVGLLGQLAHPAVTVVGQLGIQTWPVLQQRDHGGILLLLEPGEEILQPLATSSAQSETGQPRRERQLPVPAPQRTV